MMSIKKSYSVVARSNKVKSKLPLDGETVYPGGLVFPGQNYEKLQPGRYQLRLSAMPIDRELSKLYKVGKAEGATFSIR